MPDHLVTMLQMRFGWVVTCISTTQNHAQKTSSPRMDQTLLYIHVEVFAETSQNVGKIQNSRPRWSKNTAWGYFEPLPNAKWTQMPPLEKKHNFLSPPPYFSVLDFLGSLKSITASLLGFTTCGSSCSRDATWRAHGTKKHVYLQIHQK